MTSIMHKTRLAALTAVLGASLLAACSSYNSLTSRVVQRITPYRVTIVQGNFVSSEAAAKLHVGMSREAVRSALGTPLLVDMFHPERWDYVFYFKRGSTAVVEQRDLIVNFNGDTVTGWTGADNLPSEQDLIAMIDGDRREKTLIQQKRASSTDAAKDRAADATAASAPAAASAAAASAPATGSAATNAVPPNQRAADAANIALDAPAAPAPKGQRNVPQNVVRNGPQSTVNSTPEPQFRFNAPNHLRPASGSSLLAQPPSIDNTAPDASAAPASGQ